MVSKNVGNAGVHFNAGYEYLPDAKHAGVILVGCPGLLFGRQHPRERRSCDSDGRILGSFARAVLPTPVNFDRGAVGFQRKIRISGPPHPRSR